MKLLRGPKTSASFGSWHPDIPPHHPPEAGLVGYNWSIYFTTKDQTPRGGLLGFLLAHIAEDEADARRRLQNGEPPEIWHGRGPARVLAECEVMRTVVALCSHPPSPSCECSGCTTVVALAARYAAHKDYRPEWKPQHKK